MTGIKQPMTKKRGRRPLADGPALDRERLIEVLIGMARAGGIASLNIRPVAQALGVSPRLIYHHVRDKEDMLALLTDEIVRQNMPDLSPVDWEARLRNIVASVHLAYRDVPGSAAFILSRSANRLEQPHALKIREAIFGALDQAGLPPARRGEILILFSVIVLGNVIVAESLPEDDVRLAMQRDQVEAAYRRSTDLLLAAIRMAVSEN
ncbi:MAG: TetR family transcriptional regulator [Rhizorhabdus sp.]|nr:TetR family transcriptional regulator [Rhizorhabdus sp.]